MAPMPAPVEQRRALRTVVPGRGSAGLTGSATGDWTVVHPHRPGAAVAHQPVPGAVLPTAVDAGSPVIGCVQAVGHPLGCAPAHPDEPWLAVPSATRNGPPEGLPGGTPSDRTVEDTGVVPRCTVGMPHGPRPEGRR